MKLPFKTPLTLLIPAVLAGSAAAQVAILPSGSNPRIGAPLAFPGPVSGPAANIKIELPSPRLGPGLALAPAPAVMGVFPVLPIPKIPSNPIVPVIRPIASRENVAHPLAPILPGLIAQLDPEEKADKRDWKKEIGDQVFDGRLVPERKPVVVPGRTIGLPETDLEKEIGAY